MIPLFKVHMPESVIEPLKEVLLSGFIGQGPKVEEFEKQLKIRFNWDYLVTLNNGTAGLHLALQLVGIEPGQEVISTPLTCFATNSPLLQARANIKWADIQPDTCNICPESVLDKVSNKTKAIVVVHWGGYPADIEEIEKGIINKLGYKIPIIEDCAHAFGAKYSSGSLVGTSNNYCIFSLQSIKSINTIDGGILFVPGEQYSRAKLLRWYGIDRECKTEKSDFRCEIDIPEAGWKFHMNDVSATIGIEQLKYIDNILKIQRNNAWFYDIELKDTPGLKLIQQDFQKLSSYWLYTIRVEKRENFMKMMNSKGIQVSRVHERNDIHSCLARFRAKLPNLDIINNEIICIPVGWWVTLENRYLIAKSIKEGW